MQLKRLGITVIGILILGLTVVANASAIDPVFLFAGQTGTISKGEFTLSVLTQFFSTTCKESTGTVTAGSDADTFTGSITFKNCTGTGLGEPSGQIKLKFKGLTCLWGATETELKPCAVIETAEIVHMEIPLIGLIDFLAGSSQACKLTPDGTATKVLEMTCEKLGNGDQELLTVKDLGKTISPAINVLENHKTPETKAAIANAVPFLITFTNAGTLDG